MNTNEAFVKLKQLGGGKRGTRVKKRNNFSPDIIIIMSIPGEYIRYPVHPRLLTRVDGATGVLLKMRGG